MNGDKTINELLPMLTKLLDEGGSFHIKFTCQYCGARQTSDTPNVIHTKGYTCEECNQTSHPTKYGVLAILKPAKQPAKQTPVERFLDFLATHLCSCWSLGGSINCKACNKKELCDYIDSLLNKK